MDEWDFIRRPHQDTFSDNEFQRKVVLRDNRGSSSGGKLFDKRTTQLAQRSNDTGLPDNLKHGIESLSGMSMDNVKVHYNSSRPAQLNAHAYAQGTDIHVAPGQEKHLPHEAWHVVQQAQGRVKPTMQMKQGVPVNDDKGLEREADVMGARANHITAISDLDVGIKALQHSDSAPNQFAIQRQEIKTYGGTFKADPYKLIKKDPKEGGRFNVGCEMKLEFYANPTVNCSEIGLTQTTTPTVKKGGASREHYAAERGLARAAEDTVEGEDVAKARYLDRTNNAVHPIFGAKNPDHNSNLLPVSFHSENDQLGAHELDKFGKVIKDEPAVLLDMPGRDWNDNWSVIQSFETTALCLSGPMHGDYLGSVEWGYKYGPGDDGNVLPLKKISNGFPSLKFMESVSNWNKAEVPQKLGPKLNTIAIPENERVGTDKALSLSHRSYMFGAIDTLQLGGVLKLLKDPVFSDHSRQLLWRRLSALISANPLHLAKKKSDIPGKFDRLSDKLVEIVDEIACEIWEEQEWTIDNEVRAAMGVLENGEVKVVDLKRLLANESESSWSVLLFLNGDRDFGGNMDMKLGEGARFKVPFNLLSNKAKAL